MISKAVQEAAGRTFKGATIAWGGGQCYDFDTPNPQIVTIEDIAYALAFTVRWRGQNRHNGGRVFYGVGQHCVFGAEEMLRAGHGVEKALEFLTHEDDEVVLPDFPGPAKNSVEGLRPFAKRQGDALAAHYGWPRPDPDLCKVWDMRMMNTEKRDIMTGHSADTFQTSDHVSMTEDLFPAFERRIVPYSHPAKAARRWLSLYRELGGPGYV